MFQANIVGGGWVTARGHGRLLAGDALELSSAVPELPPGKTVFGEQAPRLGRLDRYTRAGFTAAALALRDAGLDSAEDFRAVGVVGGSRWECLETDLAYQRTTMHAGGAEASPHLFSYTLPGVVLGECAVHFRLTGPTLSVGDDSGAEALRAAMRLLRGGHAEMMLAGWIECPPQGEPSLSVGDAHQGSIFVALAPGAGRADRTLTLGSGGALSKSGQEIGSIAELFPMRQSRSLRPMQD